MDPSVLTVYTSPYPKRRIGRDFDGGYIIVDIPNVSYTLLLSGGIGNDLSFEAVFLYRYPSAKCYAFDGTISNSPGTHPRITFVRKNIGDSNTESTTDLQEYIPDTEVLFLKMDIEGGEIPWLLSLPDNSLSRFEQIVIEFHFPFSEREQKVFEKLNQYFYLVHFHPNNATLCKNVKGIAVPYIFECTYLHKKYFLEPPSLNKDLIPGKLDMPNTPRPDIYINYPPFVHRP